VSYQTAWLKANHPVEFMAAVMNLDLHLTDKLATYVQECRRTGIEIAPPCVNRSEARFTVREGRILYALGALKNVGVEAMRLIVEARAEGPFAGLFDLARRVDLKAIGKRPLEMLARAGALEALEPNRRRVFDGLDKLVEYSATLHAERASAQVSLFGGDQDALPPPRLPAPEDWLPMDRLREEHGAVGFYLSGHPLEDYAGPLRRKKVLTHAEFAARAARGGASGRVAGTLAAVQYRKSARGTRFAFLGFSDPTGTFEVMAFSDVLTAIEDHLAPGANLVLTVEAEGGDEGRLMLRRAEPIEGVIRDAATSEIRIYVETAEALPSIRTRLAAAEGREGRGQVTLRLSLPDLDHEADLTLPGTHPTGPGLRGALKAVPGVLKVEEV
ncbi:MAG: DNA polymerase III subunit alpha, partial [Pseudomonadota bacterium]